MSTKGRMHAGLFVLSVVLAFIVIPTTLTLAQERPLVEVRCVQESDSFEIREVSDWLRDGTQYPETVIGDTSTASGTYDLTDLLTSVDNPLEDSLYSTRILKKQCRLSSGTIVAEISVRWCGTEPPLVSLSLRGSKVLIENLDFHGYCDERKEIGSVLVDGAKQKITVTANSDTVIFKKVFSMRRKRHLSRESVFSVPSTSNPAMTLQHAAQSGNIEMIRTLSNIKVHINDRLSATGETALLIAISAHHTAAAQELMNRGANLNKEDTTGRTPLHAAVRNFDTELAHRLISRGANINVADEMGVTPLMDAGWRGLAGIVRHLIEKGAVLEMQDKFGESALLTAAKGGHFASVQLLLEANAKIDVRDEYGKTALSWAVMNIHFAGSEPDHLATTTVLVEKGANVNDFDKDGTSILNNAVRGTHPGILKFLLRQGVKPRQIETALEFAKQSSTQEIVQILESAVGTPTAQ
jgi:ankyrin repeat protein